MKGITPIISIIILLLITVALAGAAWTYMSGFMGAYTEKSFVIPTGGAYCDSAGKFHVRVVNTGTTAITSADWIKAEVSNRTFTMVLSQSPVSVRGTAELTNISVNHTNSILSGEAYTIAIGTVAGLQQIPVVCP